MQQIKFQALPCGLGPRKEGSQPLSSWLRGHLCSQVPPTERFCPSALQSWDAEGRPGGCWQLDPLLSYGLAGTWAEAKNAALTLGDHGLGLGKSPLTSELWFPHPKNP